MSVIADFITMIMDMSVLLIWRCYFRSDYFKTEWEKSIFSCVKLMNSTYEHVWRMMMMENELKLLPLFRSPKSDTL